MITIAYRIENCVAFGPNNGYYILLKLHFKLNTYITFNRSKLIVANYIVIYTKKYRRV